MLLINNVKIVTIIVPVFTGKFCLKTQRTKAPTTVVDSL